ncbi:neuropilin and tolloid-like protein 2 isoform X2 [Antedon mediterranea]|uniref:neuropilin and tolloid-like protein 2 isoform X2 n=1 Tax=Antedon mediterranea TaxID=105859 RepID=UPI003AF4F588
MKILMDFHNLRAVISLLIFHGSSQIVGGDENPSMESDFPYPGYYLEPPYYEEFSNDTGMSGSFYSPFYPEEYITNDEQVYLFKAPENYVVEFSFPTALSMESSENCKFDRLEIRDGMFGFSPLLGKFCGSGKPSPFRTTGRYAWAHFIADDMIDGEGFHASYEYIKVEPPPEPPEPDCVFMLEEQDGIISSSDFHNLYNMSGFSADDELECVWIIWPRALGYKLLFQFDMFNLRVPHSCEDNSITLYERLSSDSIKESPNLQRVRYCSTSAPYVAMITSKAFVRFKANGNGRRSSFRIIYSTYRDGPCNETINFSCNDEICIDKHLVCNGIVDCHKLSLDEQDCDIIENKNFFDKVDTMLGCMIGVISVVIIVTLCFVCRHSIHKTKKKAIVREKERKISEQNFQNINYLMDTNEDIPGGTRHRHHQQGRDYLPLTLNPVSNGIQSVQSAFTYETMNGDPIPRDNKPESVKKTQSSKSTTHQVQLHSCYKPPGYETLVFDPPI